MEAFNERHLTPADYAVQFSGLPRRLEANNAPHARYAEELTSYVNRLAGENAVQEVARVEGSCGVGDGPENRRLTVVSCVGTFRAT